MTNRRTLLGAAIPLAVAMTAVLVAGCGHDADPPPAAAPSATAGTTPASRGVATTEAPGTTQTVAPDPTDPTPSPSTPSTSAGASTTTTRPGSPTNGAGPTSTTLIPAGTSAAEKAWCAQAKPVSTALNNLFTLTPAQLETLVNQANALVPTAPPSVQAQLTILHDVGAKFLAAVKAGQATISVDGITQWAAVNLTAKQAQDFLDASTAVTSYITRTC